MGVGASVGILRAHGSVRTADPWLCAHAQYTGQYAACEPAVHMPPVPPCLPKTHESPAWGPPVHMGTGGTAYITDISHDMILS